MYQDSRMPNVLDDTQKSLAAALARLEIQRLRIDKLKIENVHLRNVLRAHDINPGEEEAAAGDDTEQGNAGGQSKPEEHAEHIAQMPEGDSGAKSDSKDSQSYDILLYTGAAKVPGRVSFKDDRIEFVAVAADIKPQTFVGVRYLGEMPVLEPQEPQGLARRSQPTRSGGSSTWWDSLWGSQGDLPSSGGYLSSSLAARYQTTPSGTKTPGSGHSLSPALSPRTHPAGFSTVPVTKAGRARPTQSAATASDSVSSAAVNLQEGATSALSQMSSYLRRRSLPEAPVTSDKVAPRDPPEGSATGTWQIIWRDSQETLQTLSFETSAETRALIGTKVEQFQAMPARPDSPESDQAHKRNVTTVGESRVRDPEPLIPGTHNPLREEKSKLLTVEEAQCVAAGIPGRRKLCHWKRLYCSEADGFSLQTMYRAGATSHYSVLLVEDFSGHVFGAYCPAELKVSPRYSGNGECFVFQTKPHRVKYDWHQLQGGARNDFFMMVSNESLGVGGAPHFAIWLDSDLLYGNSGLCATFSSPCLSGDEDFKVKSIELWGLKT